MLARRGVIALPDGSVFETPLLLHSFSSRGFPDIKRIMNGLAEIIRAPALVSAYDVKHDLILRNLSFIYPLVFIDSGGYECLNSSEIVGHDKSELKTKSWSLSEYKETIEKLLLENKTHKVIIGYDSYGKVERQIKLTRARFKEFEKIKKPFIKEILVKSESKKDTLLSIDKITSNIQDFSDFNIIGFTEKELGDSLLSRLRNLIEIRKALDEKKMKQPIHIFGSLDTMTTPLYFLCGADIFDGLTWLRYGYLKGLTIYQPNVWLDRFPIDRVDYYSRLTTFINNYNYLQELSLQMKAFVKNQNLEVFDGKEDFIKNSEFFEKILAKVI